VLVPDPVSATKADVRRIHDLARLEREGGTGELRLSAGRRLRVTSLGKPYYPEAGYTKGDVMRYYVAVSRALLPLLRDRPLSLRRFPDGIDGDSFFQQKAPENVPDGVRVEPLPAGQEAGELRFVGGDLATLLYLVQLGTISMDPWHSRMAAFDSADYAVLDLDPESGLPFGRVVEVAAQVHRQLQRLGLHGAVKTSGSRGLHIALPLPAGTAAERARRVAELLALRVAEACPELATVERAVDDRPPGSVYLDFMQNDVGKTVAAAYAVRARPGATVSAPLRWDELRPDLDASAFTIATMPERLVTHGDIWKAATARRNSRRAIEHL
jgi:bifunctional non-homologous end joining protein LigD